MSRHLIGDTSKATGLADNNPVSGVIYERLHAYRALIF
jgi:hypothetical protein